MWNLLNIGFIFAIAIMLTLKYISGRAAHIARINANRLNDSEREWIIKYYTPDKYLNILVGIFWGIFYILIHQ